jgi:hypothetical protein
MGPVDLEALLAPRLDAASGAWLAQARGALKERGTQHLPVLWAQLARRIGRARLDAGTVREGEVEADLGAWRACDAAGLLLATDAAPDDDMLVDLYLHGDLEERAIVLRCLAFRPVTAATVRLFGEMQRTNTVLHFEAGALDSNLAVRALRAGGEESGFTRQDFQRLVLKLAFLDLGLWRMFGALEESTPQLAATLHAYATEREAANRTVWKDTYRILGHAPVPGAAARLLGGIEHGDDETRLAAAEGLLALGRPDLAPFARERIEREPRAAIREILEQVAALS